MAVDRPHSLISATILYLVQFSVLHSMAISSTANITTNDQDALLSLKSQITNDPDDLLSTNWSSTTSVCNWIGVTCSQRHRRVTQLDISFMSLTGTIPPQLGNLSFLSYLIIRNNSFYGSLPDELAKLRRLYYIDLSFNNFDLETIPSWFGNFPNLNYLCLRSNKFGGTIPLFLGNMSSLIEVDLSYNQLSGNIPSSIFTLSSLEMLDISNNQLFGPFPSIEMDLPSLQVIDFTENKRISGPLPTRMFNHLPNLRALHLSGNKFNGEIPSALSNCKRLEILALASNNFTGEIPKEIGDLVELKGLYLGSNELRGQIPTEIGNLPNLETLVLSYSNLVGLVPPTIFNITTLRILALTNNSLTGSLPPSIGFGLPNLEGLYLAFNNFSGSIPSSISNPSNLSVIDLGTNSFSGFIPTTLGNLRKLKWLNFGYNFLTSSAPDLSFLSSLTNCKDLNAIQLTNNPLSGIFPSSIGNISNTLEVLDMDDCNISGSIPEEISKLNNLMVLTLRNNQLTGSIPAALGQLDKLQGLYLRGNKLEGSIPDGLCRLDRLVELHLSNNNFSGPIPACLGNLVSLRNLTLSSNKLTTVIPSRLWNLTGILHLNLSSNSLNGILSTEIGNLKVAVDIDLSRNNLSGAIPTTIGDLKDLQILSLGSNRLRGSIPESLSGVTSLEFLDLSDNNLSGTIPTSFEELVYLKYLNLSFNVLEGEVPSQGSFANFSGESFIGNSALCGSSRLQMPRCNSLTHRKQSRVTNLVIAIVLPLVVVVMVLIVLVLIRCKNRVQKKANDVEISPQKEWRRISYLELSRATDRFSESNLLGKGSYGSVYKGTLSDGSDVAIKVFHLQFEGAIKSFDVECQVMSKIRHRNLVKIMSSCSNNDFKALILEYMPNGSLENYLYSDIYSLDIFQRLSIMIDVASALEYIHFDYSSSVVHCDLKPSNVLLDRNMVAHLSDFGIAKLMGEGESMRQTQILATIGYMAPEYGREGIISSKGDVYSFGIMLMETFTRKRPTDVCFTGEMTLKRLVGESLHDSVIEVVDTNLLKREDVHFSAKEECISSILSLAMDCTNDLPGSRIDMKIAVSRLIHMKETLLAKTRRARRT